jgi:GAF domain-containing protein/two-component sensor histidine kinase
VLSAADLRALAELGGVFGSNRKLDETLFWLDEHVKPLIGHDRFVVAVLSADHQFVTTIYVTGTGRSRLLPGESDPTEGTLAGHVATHGESFFESSVDDALVERFPGVEHAIADGIRSWISVPLSFDGVPYGSASFLSHTNGRLDERALQVAEIVSGYIASAINTDQLVERLRSESSTLQRDRVRDAALKEIGLTITSSLNIRDVFYEFSELAKLLIPSEYVSVVRIRENESVIRDPFIAGDVIRREPVDLDSSISGEIARTRLSFVANLNSQSEIDDLLIRFPSTSFDISHGFRSFLSVPLVVENHCVGAMHFRDNTSGKLSEEHIEIAEQIATFVGPAVVNADLHLDAQHESEVQEMLAEMSRLMGSTMEVTDVVLELRELATSVLPAERMVISLSDEEFTTERRSYIAGEPIPDQDSEAKSTRSSRNVSAFSDKTVTVTPTEELDTATPESDLAAYRTRQAGLRSAMFAPLISDGKLIGTINVKSSWPSAYGEREQLALRQIAQQLSGSIAASEIAGILRSEYGVQETLAQLSRLVSSTNELDEILDEVADLLSAMIPVDRFVITLIDDDTGVTHDRYVSGIPMPGWDDQPHGASSGFGPTAAVETREVIIVPTEVIDSSKRASVGAIFFSKQAGLRSAMYAPLIVDGRLIGTVNVKSMQPNAYGLHEKNVFSLISQQISGSLAASTLSGALQLELDEQEALAEIAQVISSSMEIEAVFDEVAEILTRVVPGDAIFISTLSPDESSAIVRHNWGAIQPGTQVGDIYALKNTQLETVVQTGEPLTISETNIDELLQKIPKLTDDVASNLRSQITAPLVSDGRVFGIFGIRSTARNVYTTRHVGLIRRIAGHIAGEIVKDELNIRLRQTAAEQGVIAEIGRLMSSSSDLDDLMDEFDRLLQELLPNDRLVVALLKVGDQTDLDRYVRGDEISDWDGKRWSVPAQFESHLSGAPWEAYVADLTKPHAGLGAAELDLMRRMKLVSGIYAPLVLNNSIIGTISIKSRATDAYDDQARELFDKIARQISGSIGATRLSIELRREAAEQEKLAELGRVINSSNSLEEIWADLGPILLEIIDADRISFAFKRNNQIDEITILTHGLKVIFPPRESRANIYPSVWNSTSADVELDAIEPNPSPHAIEVQKAIHDAGLRSNLLAPVVRQGSVIAVLNYRSLAEGAFSESDIRLVKLITAQISGAVANSHAFWSIERAADTRESLAELGRILSLSLDIEDRFEQVGAQIQKLIQVDRVSLSKVNDDGKFMVVRYVYESQIEGQAPGWNVPLTPDAAQALRDLRKPILVNAASIEKHPWLKSLQTPITMTGLPTLFFCPVVWEDEVIGILGFRSSKENAYDESDLQMAELIANRISGFVASSQTYEATKRESEVRRALANISVAASRDLDLPSVGSRITEGLRSLIPFDRIAITSYNTESQGAFLDYFDGVAIEGDSIGKNLGQTYIDENWKWGEQFPKIGVWSKRNRELAESGLKSWIAHPLGIEDSTPTGFITISCREENFYTKDHEDLLRQVAIQITPAIQNAKVHEQSILLAQEREQGLALDQENKELQRVADARSEFLSTVSHELRTPLTAISAFADILHRNNSDNLTDRQMEQLEVVRRSSTNLSGLIDDLLDVSRADGGQLSVDFEPFNFSETIDEFIAGTRGVIDNKSQTLAVKIPDQPIWLDADKSRLLQIINNLLSNASKYSPESSAILLDITADHKNVTVEFSDDGIGVSTDDLKRVFDPFFRSSNPETQQELGTGLGLAVVKSLVELHHGRIEMSSKLGSGTRINFVLPCVIEPAQFDS